MTQGQFRPGPLVRQGGVSPVSYTHLPILQQTYEEYLNTRKRLNRTKPINLMDIGTIVAKYLKKQGKMPKLDESEEINACTVKIKVDTEAGKEDWLLLSKNETQDVYKRQVHIRSACPPIMYGCKFLNFSTSRSPMELLARRTVYELEGEEGDKHLEEYSDPNTDRGKKLRETICEKLHFTSLEYQSLDKLIEAIGLEPCKVCTCLLYTSMHTLKPLDTEILLTAARETGCVVTTEEANVIGGLGSAVAEYLSSACPVPVVRHGVADEFGRSGAAQKDLCIQGLQRMHVDDPNGDSLSCQLFRRLQGHLHHHTHSHHGNILSVPEQRPLANGKLVSLHTIRCV